MSFPVAGGVITSVLQHAYESNTATSSTTALVANVYSGSSLTALYMTGTLGGAANLTLPSVASVVASFSVPVVAGQTWIWRVANASSANHAWTVVNSSGGWTLNGTVAINQSTWNDFLVTLLNGTTGTMQNIGSGTVT